MKLLLDENLPHQLRHELPGHQVFTVAYMKWSGVENGELLRSAASEKFDAIITNDRGLEYEQNIGTLPLSVVVILTRVNTIESLRTVVPELLGVLSRLGPCELVKLPAS